MLTQTDDFFCHQIVEPHEHVALNDPTWAERAYFPVSDPERFALDAGISMFPNADTIEAYAIATTTDGPQVSLRASRDLSSGRWPLWSGPIRMEVLEPLRRWRLVCQENESGLAFDLEYVARGQAHETRSPKIYRRHRLVYDNVNLLQSGRYTGQVQVDGRRFTVDRVPGHRDRTWGVRTSGEGHVPRGLFAWLSAEFEDVSVMAIIHDRYNGTPVRRSGAVSYEGGRQVELVEFEHDLEFDYDSRQLRRAVFRLRDAEGTDWEVHAEPKLRLFLQGAGYTTGARPRGRLGMPLWTERWNTSQADVLERVDELNDNISVMRCGERSGHGVVETLLGEHDHYRVAPRAERRTLLV
jgi:hypothetical protein